LTDQLIIEEEYAEGVLLSILLILSLLLSYLYKHELDHRKNLIQVMKNENKTALKNLVDSFKYIGIVNIQLREMKTIFNTDYLNQETKIDIKKAIIFFSERVLNIVSADWVLFRIIDINTQDTITERFQSRGDAPCQYPHICNKMIVENQISQNSVTIISNRTYFNIVTSCNLPTININKDQHFFINAIVNQLNMLFVVLNSAHYKNDV